MASAKPAPDLVRRSAANDHDDALDLFAFEVNEALHGGLTPRERWSALLSASQRVWKRRGVSEGASAYAVMRLALAELDEGRAPPVFKPEPSGWRRVLSAICLL